MILGSSELDKFIVEPWMKLKPFDPKLIKKIQPDHPYKILLFIIYKYNPGYNDWEEYDVNPDYYDDDDNPVDFYFRLLNDYTRYGIAFERNWQLFPDNKLGVFENEDFGKHDYNLVENIYDLKTLLFNNVKTIDLNEHDRGEKPLSDDEKLKRDLIKKQTNKKHQVALMDPDVYNYPELFKLAIENPDFYIKKFNHRMTWYGIKDFLKIKFD